MNTLDFILRLERVEKEKKNYRLEKRKNYKYDKVMI